MYPYPAFRFGLNLSGARVSSSFKHAPLPAVIWSHNYDRQRGVLLGGKAYLPSTTAGSWLSDGWWWWWDNMFLNAGGGISQGPPTKSKQRDGHKRSRQPIRPLSLILPLDK